MSCSCRTAPWRAFLSGLAQVHRLETTSAQQPALRAWSGAALPRARSRDAASLANLRGFHSTSRVAQEGAAAAAAVPEQPESDPNPAPVVSASSDSAASEGILESTSVKAQNAEQKTKRKTSADGSKPKQKLDKKKPVAKRAPKPSLKSKAKKEAKQHTSEASAGDGTDKTKKKKKQRWRDKDETELEKLRKKQAETKALRESVKITKGKQGVKSVRRQDGITISTSAGSAEVTGRDNVDDAEPSHSAAGDKPQPQQEKLPAWRVQKEALKVKFPEGWRPRKRLSPDALAGIRALNAQFPDIYTTAALSAKFEVDPEAIRRIIKSRWEPSAEEEEKRLKRWQARGENIWSAKAALGIKPPKQWRKEGIVRDPAWHEWRKRVQQREREREEEEVAAYKEQRAASLQARVAGKVL